MPFTWLHILFPLSSYRREIGLLSLNDSVFIIWLLSNWILGISWSSCCVNVDFPHIKENLAAIPLFTHNNWSKEVSDVSLFVKSWWPISICGNWNTKYFQQTWCGVGCKVCLSYKIYIMKTLNIKACLFCLLSKAVLQFRIVNKFIC